MQHGFLLEGDRSVEAIAVTSRLIMKQAGDFLAKFVSGNSFMLCHQVPTFFSREQMHYKGEPIVPVIKVSKNEKPEEEIDLVKCRYERSFFLRRNWGKSLII